MADGLILVINCGSSSIKFAMLDCTSELTVFSGLIEKLGTNEVLLHCDEPYRHELQLGAIDHQLALQALVPLIPREFILKLQGIGHRVVHGGEQFSDAVIITEEVLAQIEHCSTLAPLHNPANLLGITAANQAFPALTNVAVFDTAFHQKMPDYAYLYPLPYKYYQQYGVRRYGFHGTSHHFVSQKAALLLNKDYDDSCWLTAHLGNGCSAAAIKNGISIDTTMGMTPLEGLMMGTRCGDIDPSLSAYLMKKLNCSIDELTAIYNKESGLLGVSQLSMDMRELHKAAASGNHHAKLAIDVFCYRLSKALGGLAIALGRVDGLIFTGGIGENDHIVREKVLQQLTLLGYQLESRQNQNHGKENKGIITQPNSPPALVIKTDEQLMIARQTLEQINRGNL